MEMGLRGTLCVCVLVLISGWAPAAGTDRCDEWNALVDEYLDKVYFPQNPSAGTLNGVHRFDAEMENYSANGAKEEVSALEQFAARVEHFPTEGLSEVDVADKAMLLGMIRSELLTREQLKPLVKNPDVYSSGVSNIHPTFTTHWASCRF